MWNEENVMKKTGIVFFCTLALGACSVEAKTSEKTKQEETGWQYHGENTTAASKKNEIVHVQSDVNGVPSKITVDTKLSGMNQINVVKQKSELVNINNMQGDEQFEKKGDDLYFENLGKDISYSGIVEKELPVKESIQYYLNDKEIDGKNLAGETGHVKIRIRYENTMAYQNVHVPFSCISFVLLPADRFENVSVTNGSVYEADDNTMVMGMAFPSLKEDLQLSDYEELDVEIPDFIEIEADVTDFSLDFTESIITNGFFSNMEEENLEDLSSLSDSLQKFGEAGNTLADSGSKLTDATTLLQNSILAYLDGIEGLQSGISQVKDGTASLSENMEQLTNAAKGLADSLNAVDISSLDTSSLQIVENVKKDLELITTSASQLSSVYESMQTLRETVNEKILDENGRQDVDASFSAILENVQSIQMALQIALDDCAENMKNLSSDNLQDVLKQMKVLQETSRVVSDGIDSLNQGMQGVNQGMYQISQGIDAAVNNHTKLKDALSQYASGLHQYQNGIQTMNADGLQKLKDKGADMEKFVSLLKKIKEADSSYQGFASWQEGQEGSVTFLIETGKISK